MTKDELKAFIASLNDEVESIIDDATDYELEIDNSGFPELYSPNEANPMFVDYIMNLRIFRKNRLKRWWRRFSENIIETIQHTVCCKALEEYLKDPEFKDKFVEVIYAAIVAALPSFVVRALPILEKRIKRIISKVYDYLVTLGDKVCSGVDCPISPLSVEASSITI